MTSDTKTVVGLLGTGAVVGTLRQLQDVVERLEATTREHRDASDRHAKALFRLTVVIAVFTVFMRAAYGARAGRSKARAL